jgi:hypothetical protein
VKKFLVLAALAATLAGGPWYFTAAPEGKSATKVVMKNLDNPRGLAFGPEGALYVVEAGRGGSECNVIGTTNFCVGATGALTRLWHRKQERVATGFPSRISPTGEVTGPHDVSFQGRGGAFVTIGFGGDPADRAKLGALGELFGTLVRVAPVANGRDFEDEDDRTWGLIDRFLDRKTRPWKVVADVAAHESAENPAGPPVDSNPYGVLSQAGARIVTDAGANALLHVTAAGDVSTLAVFPSRPARSTDSVPTEVVVGPDGAYYVSELTGAPFTAGASVVYRVLPCAPPEVFRDGFKTVIDIDFGPDGSLYVLEHATGDPFFAGPGRVIRITPRGRRTTVIEGLNRPTSVLVDEDDTVYVTNNGIQVGTGEVLRIEQ